MFAAPPGGGFTFMILLARGHIVELLVELGHPRLHSSTESCSDCTWLET